MSRRHNRRGKTLIMRPKETGARSFGKGGEGAGDFPRLYSHIGAQLKNSFELPPSTNHRATMYTRRNERERSGVVDGDVGLLTLHVDTDVFPILTQARINTGASKTNTRGVYAEPGVSKYRSRRDARFREKVGTPSLEVTDNGLSNAVRR